MEYPTSHESDTEVYKTKPNRRVLEQAHAPMQTYTAPWTRALHTHKDTRATQLPQLHSGQPLVAMPLRGMAEACAVRPAFSPDGQYVATIHPLRIGWLRRAGGGSGVVRWVGASAPLTL